MSLREKIIKYSTYFILMIGLFGCVLQAEDDHGHFTFPFQDPTLAIDDRVDDLVARLTIEEKIYQLFNNAPAIDRLGIPAYNWWNEALHGVARAGKATVFPQAIGLASTFNEELMFEIANTISDEARAKHHYFQNEGVSAIYTGLTFWSPNINIFRDPRWGRGQETYGEDPYLTGRMAVNFVRGLQGDHPNYLKTIATVKHYAVHNGPEATRHSDNFFVNDRDLYETYLPAFEIAVKEADVQSVMCAYNRFRDRPCCGSDLLLQKILRDEFGFDGYVVTDCGAVTDFYTKDHHGLVETPSQALGWAISSGTDLNCEMDSAFVSDNIQDAIARGVVNEADVNLALKRLFKARFKLGMFDPQEKVPYASIPYESVGNTAHLATAKQAAQQSLVLLKNEGLLPLKVGTKLAVIGPNADNEDVLVGNYNGTPVSPITPLQGIRDRFGKDNVIYTPGGPLVPRIYGHLKPVPADLYFHKQNGALVPGLQAQYYEGEGFLGQPSMARIDSAVNFDWEVSPISGALEETFSVKWTGIFVPQKTGKYIFNGTADLKLDGQVILDQKFGYIEYEEIELIAGRQYEFESRYIEKPHWWAHTLNPSANLLWVETASTRNYTQEALDAAAASDVVVFCGGISPRLEGEEMKLKIDGFAHGDRTHLKLPKNQEELLKKIHQLGKPIVYVNFSGSAIALNWQNENLPAIVQAFYPGEAAGEALAGLLIGDFSPSGRLPVTFYRTIDDLPDFSDYRMAGRTYRYFNGQVLYPFGHGLSYASFDYSDLQVTQEVIVGSPVTVSVNVSNTGLFDAREVVQLYLTDEESSAPVPMRSLVGMKNIFIKKGETIKVMMTILPEQMSLINKDYNRVIEPGSFQIVVGGGQGSTISQSSGNTLSGRFKLNGKVLFL